MKDWYEKNITRINILLFVSITLLLVAFIFIPFLLGYRFTIIRKYTVNFERLDSVVGILGVAVTAIVAFIPFHILKKQMDESKVYQKHAEGLNLYPSRVSLLNTVQSIETGSDPDLIEQISPEVEVLFSKKIASDLNDYFQLLKKCNYLNSQVEEWDKLCKVIRNNR